MTGAIGAQLAPLVRPFARPIVRVSGPADILDDVLRSLPSGPAQAEGAAVRLRRAGVELSWGHADRVPDGPSYLRLCHERGASSVELLRADPSLISELQVGSFFHAYWRLRVLRRALARRPVVNALGKFEPALIPLAGDLAFWAGVRSAATGPEWERLTRSSYVVLYYHRIGRGGWPGQEHLDIGLARFERQLRLLRRLGFRALSPDELIEFHSDPAATLPRRAFVVSADDALRDTVGALRPHGDLRPQVYVNTGTCGATPWWSFGKTVADWAELQEFAAAGGIVASHCREHPRLPTLDDDGLREELRGSLADLRAHVDGAAALLAYPHGHHDARVRDAVAAAGYRLAFTTEPGRNGAGTDVYCLHRVAIKGWDRPTAFLWKVATGELLPRAWERLRRRSVRTIGSVAPDPLRPA